MFISLPWNAVQPVAPALPGEPAAAPSATHTPSSYQDPASPKYHLPAVIFIGSLVGIVVLIGLLVFLWKQRKVLFKRSNLPRWARQAITAARAISFPMPASAYLCGWLRVPSPSPGNRSPPPPYDEHAYPPGSPALPPGLLRPPSAAESVCAHAEPMPSAPATYPPAPPPTPDNDGIATAASPLSSCSTPAASDMLPHAPTASFAVRSAHALGAPGLPPAHPPPPVPESRRVRERGFGSYVQDVCAVPWGSVEASTPRTSSVLARCNDEA